MGHWNYRVVRKSHGDSSEFSYNIHEVHYDDAGIPTNCSMSAIAPYGSSHEELRRDLDTMRRAFDLPTLDYDDLFT